MGSHSGKPTPPPCRGLSVTHPSLQLQPSRRRDSLDLTYKKMEVQKGPEPSEGHSVRVVLCQALKPREELVELKRKQREDLRSVADGSEMGSSRSADP